MVKIIIYVFFDSRSIFRMEARNESAISKCFFMHLLFNFSDFVVEVFENASEGSFFQLIVADLITLSLQVYLRIVDERL
jgi:hypothetical protein